MSFMPLPPKFFQKKVRERHGYAKRKEKSAHTSMEHDDERKMEEKEKKKKNSHALSQISKEKINGG